MGVCPGCGQLQRRIADDEHGVVRQRCERLEVLRFRPGIREARCDLPYVATQQLEQRDGRARRRRQQHRPTVQLSDGPSAEERHAPHWSVAGDREIGQEHELLRMACVFDGANHAEIELAGDEQVVELGRRAGDQLGARGKRDDSPVDRAVDRCAVDVADAADPHSAPSTTVTAGCFPRAAACGLCAIWNSAPCGAGPCGRADAACGSGS